MREHIKENANHNYIEMTLESWTYDRMTEEEKKRCIDVLKYSKVKGSYDARWEQLHAIYYAFLMGLGYTGHRWRASENEITPTF